MSSCRLRFNLLVVLLFIGTAVYGQAARSPFSSFGLGEQFGMATAINQGMGGTGLSNPQLLYINNLNPALLPFNRYVTFQAGVIGEQRTQQTDTQGGKSGSGNLNYIALAMPIKPGWWSSSICLMPYTRLNYQYKHDEPVDGNPAATVTVTETGSGGINQFVWSNGVALNRYVTVGLKAAYLFSSTTYEYSSKLTTSNQPTLVYPQIVDRTFVSDFQFSPAVSFHLDSIFKKDYRFHFGAVYDMKAVLNSQFNQRLERWGPTGRIDSMTLISNYPSTITMPGGLQAGMSFGYSYRWTTSVDFAYSDYSVYRDLVQKNPYETDYWRIAAGFEITPDINSLSSYLKRTTYRTGVSLENYPYLVNGKPVKDFGISFGVSLPVGRAQFLDMALKVGKKGDKETNTIEENYIKFYFGVTLNDIWFVKRRFD